MVYFHPVYFWVKRFTFNDSGIFSFMIRIWLTWIQTCWAPAYAQHSVLVINLYFRLQWWYTLSFYYLLLFFCYCSVYSILFYPLLLSLFLSIIQFPIIRAKSRFNDAEGNSFLLSCWMLLKMIFKRLACYFKVKKYSNLSFYCWHQRPSFLLINILN